jgi:hypothetical protein
MKTKSFDQFQTEDRRLVILRCLMNATQYRTNALLISRYCDAVGHIVGQDRLEQDIAWLHEQGLVVRETGEVTVAGLTARGLDVAMGRTEVPGVQRPQPGL